MVSESPEKQVQEGPLPGTQQQNLQEEFLRLQQELEMLKTGRNHRAHQLPNYKKTEQSIVKDNLL